MKASSRSYIYHIYRTSSTRNRSNRNLNTHQFVALRHFDSNRTSVALFNRTQDESANMPAQSFSHNSHSTDHSTSNETSLAQAHHSSGHPSSTARSLSKTASSDGVSAASIQSIAMLLGGLDVLPPKETVTVVDGFGIMVKRVGVVPDGEALAQMKAFRFHHNPTPARKFAHQLPSLKDAQTLEVRRAQGLLTGAPTTFDYLEDQTARRRVALEEQSTMGSRVVLDEKRRLYVEGEDLSTVPRLQWSRNDRFLDRRSSHYVGDRSEVISQDLKLMFDGRKLKTRWNVNDAPPRHRAQLPTRASILHFMSLCMHTERNQQEPHPILHNLIERFNLRGLQDVAAKSFIIAQLNGAARSAPKLLAPPSIHHQDESSSNLSLTITSSDAYRRQEAMFPGHGHHVEQKVPDNAPSYYRASAEMEKPHWEILDPSLFRYMVNLTHEQSPTRSQRCMACGQLEPVRKMAPTVEDTIMTARNASAMTVSQVPASTALLEPENLTNQNTTDAAAKFARSWPDGWELVPTPSFDPNKSLSLQCALFAASISYALQCPLLYEIAPMTPDTLREVQEFTTIMDTENFFDDQIAELVELWGERNLGQQGFALQLGTVTDALQPTLIDRKSIPDITHEIVVVWIHKDHGAETSNTHAYAHWSALKPRDKQPATLRDHVPIVRGYGETRIDTAPVALLQHQCDDSHVAKLHTRKRRRLSYGDERIEQSRISDPAARGRRHASMPLESSHFPSTSSIDNFKPSSSGNTDLHVAARQSSLSDSLAQLNASLPGFDLHETLTNGDYLLTNTATGQQYRIQKLDESSPSAVGFDKVSERFDACVDAVIYKSQFPNDQDLQKACKETYGIETPEQLKQKSNVFTSHYSTTGIRRQPLITNKPARGPSGVLLSKKETKLKKMNPTSNDRLKELNRRATHMQAVKGYADTWMKNSEIVRKVLQADAKAKRPLDDEVDIQSARLLDGDTTFGCLVASQNPSSTDTNAENSLFASLKVAMQDLEEAGRAHLDSKASIVRSLVAELRDLTRLGLSIREEIRGLVRDHAGPLPASIHAVVKTEEFLHNLKAYTYDERMPRDNAPCESGTPTTAHDAPSANSHMEDSQADVDDAGSAEVESNHNGSTASQTHPAIFTEQPTASTAIEEDNIIRLRLKHRREAVDINQNLNATLKLMSDVGMTTFQVLDLQEYQCNNATMISPEGNMTRDNAVTQYYERKTHNAVLRLDLVGPRNEIAKDPFHGEHGRGYTTAQLLRLKAFRQPDSDLDAFPEFRRDATVMVNGEVNSDTVTNNYSWQAAVKERDRRDEEIFAQNYKLTYRTEDKPSRQKVMELAGILMEEDQQTENARSDRAEDCYAIAEKRLWPVTAEPNEAYRQSGMAELFPGYPAALYEALNHYIEWNQFAADYPEWKRRPLAEDFRNFGVDHWHQQMYEDMKRPMQERIAEAETLWRSVIADDDGYNFCAREGFYPGPYHPILQYADSRAPDRTADDDAGDEEMRN
jgi:hypothetical protein